MLGDISRIWGRMKGFDTTCRPPSATKGFDPSGNEAFRLRPESGGRRAGVCPLALRVTPGEAKIDNSASERAGGSGLGDAMLEDAMSTGDAMLMLKGDDVPGTLSRDRGEGEGPSAILCKGAGSA
jgi:hypothetical protein